MALSKKLKSQAKELGIPHYWNYGKKKLEELVAAKQPKATAKASKPKPKTKTPDKPKAIVKPVSKPVVKKKDNKAEVLDHIAKCNALIEAERKLIKGPKSVQHYSMLDRSLTSLRDVTRYLAKIQ